MRVFYYYPLLNKTSPPVFTLICSILYHYILFFTIFIGVQVKREMKMLQ